MRAIRAGFVYFVCVFGAGFVLGTVRQLLLVPHFGARTAELIEIPIMLAVVVFSSRWVARRWLCGFAPHFAVSAGLIALVLLLSAEIVTGVTLRNITVFESLFAKDPLTGTLYYAVVALYALLPWWWTRK
jgi:hypothetical protein